MEEGVGGGEDGGAGECLEGLREGGGSRSRFELVAVDRNV